MKKRNESKEGRVQVGDIVQHFKRTMLENPGNRYLYQVIAFATHTETGEKLVIYKSLYADPEHGVQFGQAFARPYDMFMSKVDREKYPDVTQEYRLEVVKKSGRSAGSHMCDDYVLTDAGRRCVTDFLSNCAAKRKEILDAGKDTVDETELPTEADIIADLNNGVGVDDEGDYYNNWGVTDHYDSDYPLSLSYGEDFMYLIDFLRGTMMISVCNAGTEYFVKSHPKIGDRAYCYNHGNPEIKTLQIVHVIESHDTVKRYEIWAANEDVLRDGEEKYHADASGKFVLDDACYLVWFTEP